MNTQFLTKNQQEVDCYYEFLDETYSDASENNEAAKFEYITNHYGQNGLRIKSYLDNHSIMDFTALADKTGKSDGFYFRVNEPNTVFRYLNEISGENMQAEGIDTTYEEALAIADHTMATLFEGAFAMVHASITDRINDLEYLWNDGKQTSLGQAYVFCYTPEYAGIPSLYIDPAPIVLTEKTEYRKPYVREYVQVVVDDRGVVYMIYKSFSHTIEKLNEDVELMPFEDVLERFKKDVFHHYLWGSADITITQIEFGMAREPVKDNPNQYMMVPAWNFIRDVKSSWVQEYGKSILALNAIDGSVITEYETIVDPK